MCEGGKGSAAAGVYDDEIRTVFDMHLESAQEREQNWLALKGVPVFNTLRHGGEYSSADSLLMLGDALKEEKLWPGHITSRALDLYSIRP